jgi:manganese transport protein
MLVGWAINGAMILLAAATFFKAGTGIAELQDAHRLLEPLLGTHAVIVFAVALLFSGVAAGITSGMAAGSIFSGMYGEPFDIKDNHSRIGVGISLILGTLIIFLIPNPFHGLIISQVILSIQLPITVFLQVYLTSSEKVMGKYRNSKFMQIMLYAIALIVTALNIMLLVSVLG